MLAGFILGVLFLNILSLVIFILTGEDEMTTIKVSCGLMWYLALGFCFIVRYIKHKQYKKIK
ncbi:hypothetical protein [Clostridium disporicum]|uniref:hypothetical protein n=1 Tax=Clostridium disporicum TaxID=84024 RepID=UPI0034A1897A